MSASVYPFTALVGQDDMKLALIMTVISPNLSGVLIRGEKGTAKSTAVRALADILPSQEVVSGSAYRLSPSEYASYAAGLGLPVNMPETEQVRVPVVELPVGATEDRVAGTLDIEKALREGVRSFDPGLLAAAHRGILYVDEVNLLDDHVVDLLLDSAAMGVNTVEREGVSLAHPSRFSLVGTMNPEEGELRPQLLDRFGLCVTVTGAQDPAQRVQVMQRRLDFEDNPETFMAEYADASVELGERITKAMDLLSSVRAHKDRMLQVASTCLDAGVDGHRADIMMLRAAKTLAAWEGRADVTPEDVERAARFVLPHRMRRQPFENIAAHG